MATLFPTPWQLYPWGFLISLLIDPLWFGQFWVHQPYGPHMVPTEKVRVFFGFVCTFYLWDDASWCEKVLKPACVIFADVMRPIWLEGISHCLSVKQERTSGIVDGCPVQKLGVEVGIITGPELCVLCIHWLTFCSIIRFFVTEWCFRLTVLLWVDPKVTGGPLSIL